jgi:hypothetical protein
MGMPVKIIESGQRVARRLARLEKMAGPLALSPAGAGEGL